MQRAIFYAVLRVAGWWGRDDLWACCTKLWLEKRLNNAYRMQNFYLRGEGQEITFLCNFQEHGNLAPWCYVWNLGKTPGYVQKNFQNTEVLDFSNLCSGSGALAAVSLLELSSSDWNRSVQSRTEILVLIFNSWCIASVLLETGMTAGQG